MSSSPSPAHAPPFPLPRGFRLSAQPPYPFHNTTTTPHGSSSTARRADLLDIAPSSSLSSSCHPPPPPRAQAPSKRPDLELRSSDASKPRCQTPQGKADKANKALKKPSCKKPTFILTLYECLKNPAIQPYMRWHESGNHILIFRPQELLSHLSRHKIFNMMRFTSFTRQLNIYGFMKDLPSTTYDLSVSGCSVWTHPTLKQNSTLEDILAFKRRVTEGYTLPETADDGPQPKDLNQHQQKQSSCSPLPPSSMTARRPASSPQPSHCQLPAIPIGHQQQQPLVGRQQQPSSSPVAPKTLGPPFQYVARRSQPEKQRRCSMALEVHNEPPTGLDRFSRAFEAFEPIEQPYNEDSRAAGVIASYGCGDGRSELYDGRPMIISYGAPPPPPALYGHPVPPQEDYYYPLTPRHYQLKSSSLSYDGPAPSAYVDYRPALHFSSPLLPPNYQVKAPSLRSIILDSDRQHPYSSSHIHLGPFRGPSGGWESSSAPTSGYAPPSSPSTQQPQPQPSRPRPLPFSGRGEDIPLQYSNDDTYELPPPSLTKQQRLLSTSSAGSSSVDGAYHAGGARRLPPRIVMMENVLSRVEHFTDEQMRRDGRSGDASSAMEGIDVGQQAGPSSSSHYHCQDQRHLQRQNGHRHHHQQAGSIGHGGAHLMAAYLSPSPESSPLLAYVSATTTDDLNLTPEAALLINFSSGATDHSRSSQPLHSDSDIHGDEAFDHAHPRSYHFDQRTSSPEGEGEE